MIVPLEQTKSTLRSIRLLCGRSTKACLGLPPANRYFVPETTGAWAHGRQRPHLPSPLETSPRGTHEAFDLHLKTLAVLHEHRFSTSLGVTEQSRVPTKASPRKTNRTPGPTQQKRIAWIRYFRCANGISLQSRKGATSACAGAAVVFRPLPSSRLCCSGEFGRA